MATRPDIDAFQHWLLQQIPLLSHMGLGPFAYDGRRLEIPARLAPNVNDKGTGFGGSQATLALICGWSLLTLTLRERYQDCDVVIADSQMEYLRPVTGDFRARTALPEPAQVDTFLQRLADKGRARLGLSIEIVQGDQVAMRLQGRYVALERPADASGVGVAPRHE